MAAKDSVVQGSLITCGIFLFFSLIGNWFMYSSMDAAKVERQRSEDSLSNAQNEVRTQSSQIQVMQTMLGVGQMTDAEFEQMLSSTGGDDQMTLIEQQFVQDMALLGPNADAQNRNYHALPAFLMRSIRDLNAALAQAKTEVVTLTQEKDAIIQRETARADAAVQAKDALNTELQKARADLADARADHNLKQQQMQDLLTKSQQEIQQTKATAAQKEQLLTKKANDLQGVIDFQKDKIESLEDYEFESAQGRVVHVMAGGKLAFISLGSADGLTTGVTFSVIDQDEVRVTDVEPKGQLEVTAVRGAHLAECRITYTEELQNPIIEDDKIYTPFWKPGKKVEIALAGLLDIDGDGRDDADYLKSMISASGAKVTAHLNAVGARTGQLTYDTRFLVLGDESENATGLAALGRVKTEAKQLGITFISLSKLMGYLRSLDSEMVVPLGSASRASDFPAQTTPGTDTRQKRNVSSLYDRSVATPTDN